LNKFSFIIILGSRFAALQIKIITVKLLKKFRIKTCEKTINPMKLNAEATLLSPEGGMWLKFEKLDG
jgi:cytochrome P450 family 6